MKIYDFQRSKIERPIKVIQFGEGNFLRAFVDYMLDIANEKGGFDGSIAIVKPISFGSLDAFRELLPIPCWVHLPSGSSEWAAAPSLPRCPKCLARSEF